MKLNFQQSNIEGWNWEKNKLKKDKKITWFNLPNPRPGSWDSITP